MKTRTLTTTNQASGDLHSMHDALPSRRDDLVVEELDGEAILYNPRTGAVHRFNTTTFFVWSACDGTRTASDIARALAEKFSIDSEAATATVEQLITTLKKRELLQEESANENHTQSVLNQSPALQLSRREVLSGGAAKLVYVAPLISTFFATGAYASGPSASAAFGAGNCKNVGYSCSVNGDCCENDCNAGVCTENPGCQAAGELCFVDEDCCSDDCDLGACQ